MSTGGGTSRRLPTMADVARLAGVSRATVSFVLNDRDQMISESTRQRVLDAAQALGYRPNRTARSLRSQRTATIGFVNHEVAGNPFSGLSISGAHDSAWQHGSAVLVVNTARDAARLRAGISDLLDRRVDAILFAAVGTRRATLPDGLHPVPTILVNCFATGGGLPCVLPDEFSGARAATRLVLDAGHRSVAFLAGSPGSWATRARVRGFRRALLDAGLDPHRQILRHGNFAADSGYGLTRELLAQRHRPTAVLCGNDRMALGAYLALGEAGLRIPEDISVVGYDDQETLASEIQPPLTTVRLPYYEMGWWAAEQIFSGAVESLPARTYTPCRVVVRESVGRPRRGRRSASPLSVPWTTAVR